MSRFRWWPPTVWAALILVLTSIPASDLAPVGAFAFPGADKLVHLTLYGVLGALIARALGPERAWRSLWQILAGVALFAAADEWHQRFIPGRSADPRDFAADLTGAVVGYAAAIYFLRRRASQT